MRWEALFADLEAQLAAGIDAETAGEVAERSRSEWARLQLADRFRAHVGGPVTVLLRDGSRLGGGCTDAASEWVVVTAADSAVGEGRPVLVPLAAVSWVAGPGRAVAPPTGTALRRLGLASALRGLARDRAGVRLVLDGGHVTGTIDRVGADHLDLAEHPPGEVRRPGAVRSVLLVPFTAVIAVHSA